MFGYKEIVYVVLNITLVASFICIFFFTYVTKVEKKLYMDQIDMILNDLHDSAKLFLTPEMKSSIIQSIDKYTSMNLSLKSIDDEIQKSNHKLVMYSYIIISIFIICGFSISYYISIRNNLKFENILGKKILILVGIAFIEYIFVTYIVPNYIYIDSNYVKKTMIETLFEKQ
jgi:hypothetical protein